MDSSKFQEAQKIFGELLEVHPANVALAALRVAAVEALERSQKKAGARLDNLRPIALARPPFQQRTLREVPLKSQGTMPKLRKLKQEKNQVIDDEDWFRDNQLSVPKFVLPDPRRQTAGNLPAEIATQFAGMRLISAIDHGDHRVALYAKDFSGGRFVVVTTPDGVPWGVYDFARWRRGPMDKSSDASFTEQGVIWAQAQGDVLYVSTGHSTYAKSSGGFNAYISAINMETGDLLWQSDPLVANASNFLLRDGWLITGYGFTAEPDFLFVLDMKTGKRVHKVKLKSGPGFILEKDGRLFVRTYNMNYEFSLP